MDQVEGQTQSQISTDVRISRADLEFIMNRLAYICQETRTVGQDWGMPHVEKEAEKILHKLQDLSSQK